MTCTNCKRSVWKVEQIKITSENAHLYSWMLFGLPILLCMIICTVIMIMICRAVVNQDNQNETYRTMWQKNPPPTEEQADTYPQQLSYSIMDSFRPNADSGKIVSTEGTGT